MPEKNNPSKKKPSAPSVGLHQTEMGGKIDRNKKKTNKPESPKRPKRP